MPDVESDWGEVTRVYSTDYNRSIYVEPSDEGLDLIAADDRNAVTITLDATNVRKLRLALQRYERSRK